MQAEQEIFSRRMKKLKNGAEHPHGELMEAMHRVNQLNKTHPADFFELVKMCRFPDHPVHEQCLAVLAEFDLLYKNEVRELVKDIILSSVVGRTLVDLEIKSPLQEGLEACLLF